jgi:exodeoxyribonuclease V alpha subunit
MVFLARHGVSTHLCVKIFQAVRGRGNRQVSENPYQLAADIYGIGFVTAETLARNLGTNRFGVSLPAGIVHVWEKRPEDGHCYLPDDELVEQR